MTTLMTEPSFLRQQPPSTVLVGSRHHLRAARHHQCSAGVIHAFPTPGARDATATIRTTSVPLTDALAYARPSGSEFLDQSCS